MMKRLMGTVAILLFGFASHLIAGGSSGGTPPAVQDYAEIMDIRTDEFNALALDALSRKPLNLGGRLFRPQKIDLETRSIQYQPLAPNEPPLLIKETE